jgi:hypothetical protein
MDQQLHNKRTRVCSPIFKPPTLSTPPRFSASWSPPPHPRGPIRNSAARTENLLYRPHRETGHMLHAGARTHHRFDQDQSWRKEEPSGFMSPLLHYLEQLRARREPHEPLEEVKKDGQAVGKVFGSSGVSRCYLNSTDMFFLRDAMGTNSDSSSSNHCAFSFEDICSAASFGNAALQATHATRRNELGEARSFDTRRPALRVYGDPTWSPRS